MEKIIEMQGGMQQAIKTETRNFAEATPSIGKALRPFSSSIKELCTQGIQIRLYINPTHALTLSALYWNNKWDLMETWLHKLASIVDNARQSGCNVQLFDFSGFNSITTEAIPRVSGANIMRYYWETSHYRDNVGAMILERMFNSSNSIPDDFGIKLNAEVLPAHLRKMRLGRDQYHKQHPIETQLVKSLLKVEHLKGTRKVHK